MHYFLNCCVRKCQNKKQIKTEFGHFPTPIQFSIEQVKVKVRTGLCLPLFGVSAFLIAVGKHLGIGESSCWTFRRGMMSSSCLTKDFSCSTVHGCLLNFFFHLLMWQMLSTRALRLWSHAIVTAALCGLRLSYWNMEGLSCKGCWCASLCCSEMCRYLSALMVPVQMCDQFHIGTAEC